MEPRVERRCQLLVGGAMVLLTVGLGYFVLVEAFIADFLVVLAGLCLGWIAFLYCVGSAFYGD